MAYRNYHEEGLETRGDPQERHAFANALAQAIRKAHDTDTDIVAEDVADYCLQIYAPVFELVRAATIAAHGRRDRHWLEDASATINFVGRIHSSHPEWLLPTLQAEVRRTWEMLERPQQAQGGFLKKIQGLLGLD